MIKCLCLSMALYLALGMGVACAEPLGSRQVSVSGEAQVRVEPDQAIVSLAVETFNKEVAPAAQANDESVRRVLALGPRFGIEPRYVQSDYITIQPRYASDQHGIQILTGYLVHKSVVFTLKDLSKLQGLLTAAIEAGANLIDGVDFQTTELRKYRDQARRMAMQAAREKAVDLAKVLSQGVGKARSISEGGSYGYGSYNRNRDNSQTQNVVSNGGGSESQGDTVAPGQIVVTATVSVTFDLEP